MSDNQSLEVMRLGATGEIIQNRVFRVDAAVERMGRALQTQVINSQKALQGPSARIDYPDMWQERAARPIVPPSPEVQVIPPSAEVVNYAQVVGGSAETTPMLQQVRSEIDNAFKNAPSQEINYDI